MSSRRRSYDDSQMTDYEGSSQSQSRVRRGVAVKKRVSFKVNRKAKLSPGVRKAVQSIIVRNMEMKTQQYNSRNVLTQIGTAAWTNSNVYSLTPGTNGAQISQGTGQGDRIGNKIKIRKVLLSFIITPSVYNVTVNPTPTPQDIMVTIFKIKSAPGVFPTAQTTLTNYTQSGDSAASLVGSLTDCIGQVNKDQYTELYRGIYKVGYQAFVATPGGAVANSYWASNDYKLNKLVNSWDVTKYVTKNVDYPDTSTTPQSDYVFIMFNPCNCDGTAAVVNNSPDYLSIGINTYYTDA